jgi:hypothetical protein
MIKGGGMKGFDLLVRIKNGVIRVVVWILERFKESARLWED